MSLCSKSRSRDVCSLHAACAQQCLEAFTKDKVVFGELHALHVVVEVAEHEVDGADEMTCVGAGFGGLVEPDLAFGASAGRVHAFDRCDIAECAAWRGVSGEFGFVDFGKNNFLAELLGVAYQYAGGLGHAFDDEACGHQRHCGASCGCSEVIVEMFFRERHVLDGDEALRGDKFNDAIDPHPTHGGG